MSTVAVLPTPHGVAGGDPLAARLLDHLDLQLASAQRLLEAVLAQGRAIRARRVDEVLERLATIQAEMGTRGRLEETRRALLGEAGARLGQDGATVTLDGFATLLHPQAAVEARDRSARLRGLLDEVGREHGVNRVLMRQELTFLDHLTRLAGDEPRGAYGRPAAAGRPGPAPVARPALRTLNVEA